MFANEATIEALSPDDALAEASALLGAPPQAVVLTPAARKHTYAAKLENCDARLRVKISDDRLEAVVENWGPAVGAGAPFDVDSLGRAVRAAGVAEPVESTLQVLLAKMAAGEDVTGFVLAEGVQPREPRDARVVLSGNPQYPVFNGEPIGRKLPPKPGEPGRGVDGKPVEPLRKEPPRDPLVQDNSGWIMDPETAILHARGYGQVRQAKDGQLTIAPWLRISKDRVRIVATLHHTDFAGHPITPARITDALGRLGVKDTVRPEAIEQALAQAKETDSPVADVAIAEGESPLNGEDGSLDMLVRRPGEIADDPEMMRVNQRERSLFTSVAEGTVIARLLPPVPGKPGRDVFGRPIPPAEGAPLEVEAGDNVEMTPDGEFRALITGVVVVTEHELKVLEMLEIDGDVDYSTGNVRLEKGLLKIKGSVREGFSVYTPEDVVVGGAVESAEIIAGGSVEIGGGVLMGSGGRIKAGGDVACQFMENASVEAGGNVIVRHNISNSEVIAHGTVICVAGKGVVQGGTVEAVGGIEVNEAGSEAGVATRLLLSPNSDCGSEKALKQERVTMEETAEKIAAVIGAGDPRQILERTPEHKRKEMAQLIKTRFVALNRIKEIEREIDALRQACMETLYRARIVVRRVAHPGATFTILGKTLKLNEPAQACTVRYDMNTASVGME
jgi:uncharacterized protein (DUF342 family)